MTTTSTLFDAQGRLAVGARLGRGGEGEIFAVTNRPGQALKLYHQPTAAHEAKVTAMIAAELHTTATTIAFPKGIVRDEQRRFVGFTMAEVRGHQQIHQLYGSGTRRKLFPEADYRFLVRAAANVARAVAQVHAAGAIIGDINHSGILVSQQATVSLIDVDSFALGAKYPCRVGVPEFTPPELQGLELGNVDRTAQHDAFGLAVLVFLLLFLGRHPFAGVPTGRDVDIPQAISQGRFAYSRIRNTRLQPPPGGLSFTDLPLGIRLAFERAFGINLGRRPTAQHWVDLLDRLERSLVVCSKNDRHLFASGCTACPWCAMDARSKLSVFGQGAAALNKGPHAVLLATSRRQLLYARAILDAELPTGATTPGPSAAAVNEKSATKPDLMKIMMMLPQWQARLDGFVRAYHHAVERCDDAIAIWRERPLTKLFAASLEKVERQAAELERHAARSSLGSEDTVRIRAAAVSADLRRHRIDPAVVSGLSARQHLALKAAGIATAADVRKTKLASVPGIGERATALLLLWRDTLITRFIDTWHAPTMAADGTGAAIHDKLELSVDRLVTASADFAIKPSARRDAVHATRRAIAQAATDLRYLGLTVPNCNAAPCPVIVPVTPPPKAKPRKAAKPAAVCPRCSAPMVRRWATSAGANKRPFLGCSRYPVCNGARRLNGAVLP